MDLTKTQFLVENGAYVQTLRTFRRKRQTMLFNREGKPLHLMTHTAWQHLKETWPDEVARDGLRLHTVWTLEETK